MIRLFFTRKKYSQNSNIYKMLSIEENYKSNKAEFEYFYLECKSLRPNVQDDNKLLNKYKKVIEGTSSSLQDLKSSI